MDLTTDTPTPAGDRAAVAAGRLTIVERWLDAIRRFNAASAGCPAARAALRDLKRLEEEWQVATS